MFTLENIVGFFVPSTDNIDQIISAEDYENRILQVGDQFASWFGGFHALAGGFGGYLAGDGRLITEDSTLIISWCTLQAYEQFYTDVIVLASKLAEDWNQESVGVIDANLQLHLIGIDEKIKTLA